jgi:hypothetical protein
VYGLRLHGLSPRVVTDPRLSLSFQFEHFWLG